MDKAQIEAQLAVVQKRASARTLSMRDVTQCLEVFHDCLDGVPAEYRELIVYVGHEGVANAYKSVGQSTQIVIRLVDGQPSFAFERVFAKSISYGGWTATIRIDVDKVSERSATTGKQLHDLLNGIGFTKSGIYRGKTKMAGYNQPHTVQEDGSLLIGLDEDERQEIA